MAKSRTRSPVAVSESPSRSGPVTDRDFAEGAGVDTERELLPLSPEKTAELLARHLPELRHPDFERRVGAVFALRGVDTPEVVSAYAAALRDPEEQVRLWAATFLGRMGPAAASLAVERLTELLGDGAAEVRGEAARALSMLGTRAAGRGPEGLREALRAAVPPLKRLLGDARETVSAFANAALEALARFDPAAAAVGRWIELLGDGDAEVRGRAARALSMLATRAAGRGPEGLRAALRAAVPTLQQLLGDPEAGRAARDALVELAAFSPEAAEAIRLTGSAEGDDRAAAEASARATVEALLAQGGIFLEPAPPPPAEAAPTADSGAPVQELRERVDRVVAALHESWRRGGDPRARATAIAELRWISHKAAGQVPEGLRAALRAAVPTLQQLLDDPEAGRAARGVLEEVAAFSPEAAEALRLDNEQETGRVGGVPSPVTPYDKLLEELVVEHRAHQESLVRRFEAGLNAFLQAQAPETFEEKKALAERVSEDLGRLGLAIRHPRTGQPCTLLAISGEANRLGRFLLSPKGSSKSSFTKANLSDLLPVELMEATPRREALAEWHERVRRRNDQGPARRK